MNFSVADIVTYDIYYIFSKSIWPDGVLAETAQERDYNTKMRTRIAAKMLLFCAIPGTVSFKLVYNYLK